MSALSLKSGNVIACARSKPTRCVFDNAKHHVSLIYVVYKSPGSVHAYYTHVQYYYYKHTSGIPSGRTAAAIKRNADPRWPLFSLRPGGTGSPRDGIAHNRCDNADRQRDLSPSIDRAGR